MADDHGRGNNANVDALGWPLSGVASDHPADQLELGEDIEYGQWAVHDKGLTRAGGRALPQPVAKRNAGLRRSVGFIAPPLLGLIVLVATWQIAVVATGVLPQFLPTPARVVEMGWQFRSSLWANTVPTLEETLVGLGATIVIATTFAVTMDFSRWARRIIYPMLVGSQTIPIMVLAPLMVIWFGFGLMPKIVIIILVTFFPMTVALSDGFNATEPEAASLLRSMGASRVQEFLKVRLPTALPYFFTGLRISIAWSVVAAIFGEYVGAVQGLGIFMEIEKNNFRTDLVLAAVLVTALLSLTLFVATYAVQRLTIPWYARWQRRAG